MPRWGMIIDARKCIGCQACTIACKTENDVPLGVWRTHVRFFEKGTYPLVRRHFLSVICDHCDEAPCVEASENNGVGSFYKSKAGVILIDYNKLKGRTPAQIKTESEAAIEACPLEAVFINPQTNLPEKCTFCQHRLDDGLVPACVQTCIGRSRVFGDFDDPNSPVSRLRATNATRTLMPEDDGGGAGVHYIGVEAELTDHGAIEGGRQIDPQDFDKGIISMDTGPQFTGRKPKKPSHKK